MINLIPCKQSMMYIQIQHHDLNVILKFMVLSAIRLSVVVRLGSTYLLFYLDK